MHQTLGGELIGDARRRQAALVLLLVVGFEPAAVGIGLAAASDKSPFKQAQSAVYNLATTRLSTVNLK